MVSLPEELQVREAAARQRVEVEARDGLEPEEEPAPHGIGVMAVPKPSSNSAH